MEEMVLGIFLHERMEYMGSASSAESVVREITRRTVACQSPVAAYRANCERYIALVQ